MTTVTTQAELDEAIASGADRIIIRSEPGVWLTVSGSATVEASDSATVRAWGSATVRAWDSATVRAWDSATVRAYSLATVEAWGSATVRASGLATVRAWDSATVEAGSCVAVFLHSQQVTLSGTGHIIDMTNLDLDDPRQWAGYVAADVDADGIVHLYKALDDKLAAGHDYVRTVYAVGADVEPDRWIDNNECGGGLHACPTVAQAIDHFPDAVRFVEVTAPLSAIRPIDAGKAKAPRLHVLREVDRNGRPLTAATASADSERSES